MSRRYKGSSNKASRNGQEEDNFVNSLQSETRSEAESTTLSSILPIVKSSQVRANAPRASMPDIMNDIGTASLGVSIGTNKKSDDRNGGGETDSYTVDTNRPIDSVYIYPSGPQSTSGGNSTVSQRRNYRSGLRSITSASQASSVGNGSVGGSGSVGGILDSLGLGRDVGSFRNGGDEEMGSKTMKQFSNGGKESLRQGRSRSTGKDAGPQVHFRAALVLFFLMSILYGAFQWIAMAKANSSLALKRKSKTHTRHYGAFEEGEDRPIDKTLMAKMSAGGNKMGKIREKLAKVPKRAEGPDHVLDSFKKKPLVDTTESETKKKLAEESAPADSLEAIDKKEEEINTELSLSLQTGLAGVYTKDPSHADLPFLWYIPRSGGGMVKNVLSNCKDLVVASEVGASQKDVTALGVIDVAGHKFLNVDTTTPGGISKAAALGLATSGLAGLVVSPRIQEASKLFSSSKKGRAFAMLRHPVERAVSMFYFLKAHKVPAVAAMELEDYCKSPHVENNWMVRTLSDKMTGEVDDTHLEIAKNALKEKIIVGLLEQKEESMRRFEYHYNWKYTENPTKQSACRTRILVGDYRTNESAKGKIKEGSQAWSLLMWQNKLDMKLYKYAKALYLQQGTELFNDMP